MRVDLTIFGHINLELSPEITAMVAKCGGLTTRPDTVNWSLCPAEQWGFQSVPVIRSCQCLHHFESAAVPLLRVAFKHLSTQHPCLRLEASGSLMRALDNLINVP